MTFKIRRGRYLALAIGCMAGTTAQAQNSITLYGLADTSVAYISNQKGHSVVQLFPGDAQSSRWGLAGAEDLGGGSKAIFRIENGFTIDNGAASQGGLLFGRQALVGLTNTELGTLTLGRQYDFALDLLCPMSNGCVSSVVFAFHPGDYDRVAGERLDHAIKYVSPAFGGLQGGVLYAPGGQPGRGSAGSAFSLGASYRNENLLMGASYTSIRGYVAPFDIGAPLGGASLAGASFDRFSTGGAGIAYRFGNFLLHGLGTFVQFNRADTTAMLRTGEAGLTYQATPALRLSAGYSYTANSGQHWQQGSFSADYFLSKRTDVYCHLATMRASTNSRAALFPLLPSSGNTQSLASVGIRHVF